MAQWAVRAGLSTAGCWAASTTSPLFPPQKEPQPFCSVSLPPSLSLPLSLPPSLSVGHSLLPNQSHSFSFFQSLPLSLLKAFFKKFYCLTPSFFRPTKDFTLRTLTGSVRFCHTLSSLSVIRLYPLLTCPSNRQWSLSVLWSLSLSLLLSLLLSIYFLFCFLVCLHLLIPYSI